MGVTPPTIDDDKEFDFDEFTKLMNEETQRYKTRLRLTLMKQMHFDDWLFVIVYIELIQEI